MEKTMRDYTTQTRIGATIGKAMARDVLAEDMPREWTGLDPQDADELTAAGVVPGTIQWVEAEGAARAAYDAAMNKYNRLDADNARLNAEIDKACKSQHELRAELAEAKKENDTLRKTNERLQAELAEAKAKAKPLPSPALVKAAKELAKTIWPTAQWPTAINHQSLMAAAILALCAAIKGELTDGE